MSYSEKFYEWDSSSRLIKVILLMGFSFLISTFYMINEFKGDGHYEFSIYDVYPFHFWIMIIISISIGVTLLALSSFKIIKSKSFLLQSYLLIILCDTILLLLPLIRGYIYYGRGDVLSHIGYSKYILQSGSIGSNVYPINHLLLVSSHLLSTISISNLSQLLPAAIYLFCIITFIILIRYLIRDPNKILLGLAFSSLLVFSNFTFGHFSFIPNLQADMFIPFMIFIYLKSRISNLSWEFNVLLIILCAFIVFYHPITALMLIFIFTIINISQLSINKVPFISLYPNYHKTRNLIMILIVIFFSWSIYAYLLFRNIGRIFGIFSGEAQISEFARNMEMLTYSDASISDVLVLIIRMYGVDILIGILSLLAILYIFLKFNSRPNLLTNINLSLILSFTFFSVLALLVLILPYVFQFERLYIYCIFFGLMIIPAPLYQILKERKIYRPLIILVLVSLIILSTFNLYNSKNTNTANNQVTESELAGMSYFFSKHNISADYYPLGINPSRFFQAIYGVIDPPNIYAHFGIESPLDHFGNMEHYGTYYERPSYLIINLLGREVYPVVFPQYINKWRFSPQDFLRLGIDPTIMYIYSNGNIDLFLTAH